MDVIKNGKNLKKGRLTMTKEEAIGVLEQFKGEWLIGNNPDEVKQALSSLLEIVKRVDVERIENIIEKTSSFAPINILAQSLVDYLEKGE